MTARAAKESAVRSSCPDVIISGPCSLFQLADIKVRIYFLLRDILIWELSSRVAPLFRCTIFVIVHLNLLSHLPTILSLTVEAAYGPKEGAGVAAARYKQYLNDGFRNHSINAGAGLAKTVATPELTEPSPLTAIAIIHFDAQLRLHGNSIGSWRVS